MSHADTIYDIRDSYYLATTDGQTITVCRELYSALCMFMGKNKPAGSVLVTFKNGNVAGVETAQKIVLK